MLDHANLLRGAPTKYSISQSMGYPKGRNAYAFESVAVRFFKCRIYTTPFLRQHSMQYIQNDPLHLGHMRCRGLFCDRISDLKN